MEKVKAILAIVIIAGIIGALIYTRVIPLFVLVTTSPAITVVDEKNNAVVGATVKGVMTLDTFHWLGDVWNSQVGAPVNETSPDGVINNDDINYIYKFKLGTSVNIDAFDMDGNGQIDDKDQTWVVRHNGTTIQMTGRSNVTQSDGTCTIQIYTLYRTDKPIYYLVTADKDGYHSGSATIDMRYGGSVTIKKNNPPVVDFSWSPTIPKVGQSVKFTASAYDPDVGDTIVSYSWTLTDGGTTKTFTGQSFSYSYINYGYSTVTLTCTDSLGASNTPYPKTVHVDAGYVVVSISPSTTSGEIPLTVNFNGYAKDPDGGSITSYKWDFGDGSLPDYSNPTSHTYTSVGTFTVTLTVTDSEGVSSSNAVTITTYSSPGYASLTITSPQPFAYVGEQVVLDGSGSKASSGATITSFEWYIDGALQTTTTVSTYTYPGFSGTGSHSAKLIVTDSSGNRFESSTLTINVVERPKADFTVSGTFEVGYPLTFTFTGKGSITSYSWDFGDGSTSTEGPSTSHPYSNPGTYTVRLTVSDGRTSDSIPKQVSISVIVQVDCLTPLEFPPSTSVKVKLYAHTPEGQILGGIPLTINIKSKGSYAGYTSGGTTYPNGTAFIDILTPPSSKDSPYNMTIYSQNQFITCYELKVLPQLSVLISTSTSIEQVYVPGSYDFVCSGTVVDKETTEPVTGFGVYNIELKDEKGNVIPPEYTNYGVQASTFTFKAKTFDYYFQKFGEKYVEHTLTLKMTFTKTDPIRYIDASITVTVHMKPPYVQAVPESSSVTVGTDTFGFAFKDASGKPYKGLTASNIRITVIDPDGNQRSTDDPVNPIRYTWNDANIYIAIAYTFDKVGTYKIVVEYIGLPFTQQPQTFPIQVSEAPPPVPSILTNPYVIAFIVLIILVLIWRRRGK